MVEGQQSEIRLLIIGRELLKQERPHGRTHTLARDAVA